MNRTMTTAVKLAVNRRQLASSERTRGAITSIAISEGSHSGNSTVTRPDTNSGRSRNGPALVSPLLNATSTNRTLQYLTIHDLQ